MKILKRILLVFISLFLLFIIIGFFLPARIRVERQIEIKAPVEMVYDQINTMQNWEKWSPWFKMEPEAQRNYFGPESGVGAGYSWKGDKLKEGKMTITESNPYSSIISELEMQGHKSHSGFLFDESDDRTRVTWYFENDAGMNPFSRYMNLVVKSMLGQTFDQGLNDIKQLVESMPVAEPSKIAVEVIDTGESYYLSLRDTANLETIGMKLGQGFSMLQQEIARQKLQMAGAPFAIYYSDSETMFDMDIALATDKQGKDSGKIKAGTLPAGRHVVAHFFGDYNKTAEGHRAAVDYIQKNGLISNGPPREHYITDPMLEKDTAKWQTDIYYPIR